MYLNLEDNIFLQMSKKILINLKMNVSEDYLKKLQSHLNKILSPIIPDDNLRFKYLEPRAMVIWVRAMTHETLSPTDNYEDLEYAGDAVLKWCFPKYIIKRFPDKHKGDYTEINSSYMSKIYQAQLTRDLGLSGFIRSQGLDRTILNLETDVFESFFGALEEISDMIQDGLGSIMCYNMITHIFKNRDINVDKGQASIKTQVDQIFTRFELGKLKTTNVGLGIEINILLNEDLAKAYGINSLLGSATNNKYDKAKEEASLDAIETLVQLGFIRVVDKPQSKTNNPTVTFTISLNPRQKAFLESYGIKLNNSVIGQATGSTKKEAEFEAYKAAANFLNKLGITSEWADKQKQIRDFSDPLIEPHLKNLGNKIKNDGYVSLYFFVPRKTSTTKGAVVQLIGVKENGENVVLSYVYSTDRENSYNKAKAQVVMDYINNK